ncbi:uncharacterized protein C8Q71DRAFT_862636 [Rhodofomes roseus]|uniref:Uncharacterized protein n=1 Tax=Rhodofomes roseus TaxID=34475 RepID=A0ABQ8K1K9_9APHY|nr:uncharacterized protein C8Q71DRAFT_862636 [Rhodofomes roseus]KAH9830346.1 hypothetical protein C8Q71DRAFT_862636 [Rhodofomes roseus]
MLAFDTKTDEPPATCNTENGLGLVQMHNARTRPLVRFASIVTPAPVRKLEAQAAAQAVGLAAKALASTPMRAQQGIQGGRISPRASVLTAIDMHTSERARPGFLPPPLSRPDSLSMRQAPQQSRPQDDRKVVQLLPARRNHLAPADKPDGVFAYLSNAHTSPPRPRVADRTTALLEEQRARPGVRHTREARAQAAPKLELHRHTLRFNNPGYPPGGTPQHAQLEEPFRGRKEGYYQLR